MIYGKPHKQVNGKWVECTLEEFNEKMGERHRALEEKKRAERGEAKEGKNCQHDGQNANGLTNIFQHKASPYRDMDQRIYCTRKMRRCQERERVFCVPQWLYPSKTRSFL